MINNRKLLIFGNGLGMALDPAHFSLTNALQHIWTDKTFWRGLNERNLIQQCIPSYTCPQSEDDMDRLHLAAVSCNFLKEIPPCNQNTHWLSDDGFFFPEVTQKFIHTVATYLHNAPHSLPSKFESKLLDFIRKTNSHVATLNYDKLLYGSFIDNQITMGFHGHLVDGIFDSGFHENNLERLYNRKFGYYLHLHGSPLFFEYNNKVFKKHRHDLNIKNCYPSKHIVLTHIKHKPSVISNSEILSTYWRYLNFALFEVDEVILFGYSGLDDHLNKLLRMHNSAKKFTVVEWAGCGNQFKRQAFWFNELGNTPNLKHFNNITEFEDWDK